MSQVFMSDLTFFKGPIPTVWHNLCILNDCVKETLKYVLDSNLVLNLQNSTCKNQALGSGLKIMENFFGGITDFNIWGRILTDVEVKKWEMFGNIKGKYLSWDDAKILKNG